MEHQHRCAGQITISKAKGSEEHYQSAVQPAVFRAKEYGFQCRVSLAKKKEYNAANDAAHGIAHGVKLPPAGISLSDLFRLAHWFIPDVDFTSLCSCLNSCCVLRVTFIRAVLVFINLYVSSAFQL